MSTNTEIMTGASTLPQPPSSSEDGSNGMQLNSILSALASITPTPPDVQPAAPIALTSAPTVPYLQVALPTKPAKTLYSQVVAAGVAGGQDNAISTVTMPPPEISSSSPSSSSSAHLHTQSPRAATNATQANANSFYNNTFDDPAWYKSHSQTVRPCLSLRFLVCECS